MGHKSGQLFIITITYRYSSVELPAFFQPLKLWLCINLFKASWKTKKSITLCPFTSEVTGPQGESGTCSRQNS